MINNLTNFTSPYPQMKCGAWVAKDSGIYYEDEKTDELVKVCHSPLLIVRIIKGIQNGEEQVVLAFAQRGEWKELVVPRETMSSTKKIVELSKYGLRVTSSNAKHLVEYLSDLDAYNEDIIPIEKATSKLGWMGDEFIPYSKKYLFGGEDLGLKSIYEAIGPKGDEATWMAYVKKLRASGRFEIKAILATSLASVLVERLGVLPFVVNLYGESGKGKSVALKLGASVWGDPFGSRYIGDFQNTNVALEVKCDFLNSLPIILDDTSKVSSWYQKNFESIIYMLCSGKGKSRSNKNVGMDRERTWSNVAITSGEKPITSYCNQGGAQARTIEIECESNLFSDGKGACATLEENYGFLGKRFVKIISKIDKVKLQQLYNGFCDALLAKEKNIMGKQLSSVATLLVSDFIATKAIFKDECYITIDEALSIAKQEDEISDNERCYHEIVDHIKMNMDRFTLSVVGEHWGKLKDNMAIMYRLAFDKECKKLGYAPKSFLAWALREGLIIGDDNRVDKNTKLTKEEQEALGRTQARCVYLRLDGEVKRNSACDEAILEVA